MNLVNAIRRLLLLPERKIRFAKFDITSDYVNPMMITGKRYINIGKRVFIRDYARIEAIDSYNDHSYNPKMIMEDDVSIQQGFHATCTSSVVIKKGVTISSYVYISDTSHGISELGERSVLETELHSESVKIGKYAFIGTGVKIMPGVSIGTNAVIGANAVVTTDIPDYCMAVGVPARVIKKYDYIKEKWIKI